MAKDDLIFESDREEKRARIKNIAIIAGCILLAVIIAIAAAIIIGKNKGKTMVEGADSLYPISWSVGKDGKMKLSVDCSASPGCSWDYQEPSPILSIEKALKQPEDATNFTVTPEGPGRGTILLDLKDGESGSPIYRLTINTEAKALGEGYDFQILSSSGTQIQGSIRGGGDGRYNYLIEPDSKGGLSVIIMSMQPVETEEEAESAETAADAGYFEYEGQKYPIDPSWPEGEISVKDGEIYITLEESGETVPLVNLISNGKTDEAAKAANIPEGQEESPRGGEPESGSEFTFPDDWKLTSSNTEAASDGGVFFSSGYLEAFINPGAKAGKANIDINSESSQVKLSLELELTEAGKLIVQSHSISQ